MPPKGPVISTPRGTVIVGKSGNAYIKWNPDFKPKWQWRFSSAQEFVDAEIVRTTEPYVPRLTGSLIASGILGTVFGSGLVQWIVPYARYQYYSKRAPGSPTGPLRGPYWFERSKAVNKKIWIAGARKLAGGGS